MKIIEHYVGGKLTSGKSDRKGKVFNPATGEQEKEVVLASKADLDDAVKVAQKAFETWSLKPALQRARILFKFNELIEKNSDELAELIVAEHGKVYEAASGVEADALALEFEFGMSEFGTTTSCVRTRREASPPSATRRARRISRASARHSSGVRMSADHPWGAPVDVA